eukprot:3352280-Rhodomonas_salina.1
MTKLRRRSGSESALLASLSSAASHISRSHTHTPPYAAEGVSSSAGSGLTWDFQGFGVFVAHVRPYTSSVGVRVLAFCAVQNNVAQALKRHPSANMLFVPLNALANVTSQNRMDAHVRLHRLVIA